MIIPNNCKYTTCGIGTIAQEENLCYTRAAFRDRLMVGLLPLEQGI